MARKGKGKDKGKSLARVGLYAGFQDKIGVIDMEDASRVTEPVVSPYSCDITVDMGAVQIHIPYTSNPTSNLVAVKHALIDVKNCQYKIPEDVAFVETLLGVREREYAEFIRQENARIAIKCNARREVEQMWREKEKEKERKVAQKFRELKKLRKEIDKEVKRIRSLKEIAEIHYETDAESEVQMSPIVVSYLRIQYGAMGSETKLVRALKSAMSKTIKYSMTSEQFIDKEACLPTVVSTTSEDFWRAGVDIDTYNDILDLVREK